MKKEITFHEAFHIVNSIPYITVFSDYYAKLNTCSEEFYREVYFSDDNTNGEGYELIAIDDSDDCTFLNSQEVENGKWYIVTNEISTFLQLRDSESDSVMWQGRIYTNKVSIDQLVQQ